MPKKISDIRSKLLKPVPKEHLKDRKGPGGKTLYYIDGDYVTFQLNEIFGVENVEITVPTLELEAEHRYVKPTEVTARRNPETREYEAVKSEDIPFVEFTYRSKVAIKVSVLDEAGELRTFVREGIGTGLGSANASATASLHQARQIAIKYAATDGLKRAAKQIGTIFGLSIGENGVQSLAVDTDEADVDEAAQVNAGATTPAPSAVLSNESAPKANPASVTQAPQPSAQQTTRPQAPQPNAAPKPADVATTTSAAPQNPAPVQTQSQASRPAAAPNSPQAATAATKPPAQAVTQAETASNAVAPEPEIPAVDVEKLKTLGSMEWIATFRKLNSALGQSRSLESVSKIARISGTYFALVNKAPDIEPEYKTNVENTMRKYLNTHIAKHQMRIDLEAEINFGRQAAETPAPAEEAIAAPGSDSFEPPF